MFYRTDEPHGLPHDPFKSCIVPRPIAWVSTLSPAGVANLAPFSFFNGVASDPPMLMFSVNGSQPDGRDKDTLLNIEATGEFVVHMVPGAMADAMNATCAPLDADVDEFTVAGLEKAESKLVKPPRVAAAPVAMECRLHETIHLPVNQPTGRNVMVLGIHIDDTALRDGLIDIAALQPLSRLGYKDYSKVETLFQLERPTGTTGQSPK